MQLGKKLAMLLLEVYSGSFHINILSNEKVSYQMHTRSSGTAEIARVGGQGHSKSPLLVPTYMYATLH